nr:12059_t:CDS:2 [Entrophospora candida]
MGHSKKQKLHKIVQLVLPQIIIPSEPEKNPSTPNRSEYTDILNEEEDISSNKEEFNSGDEITSHYNRNHKRIIDDIKEDRSVQKKIQSNVHDHSRYAKVNEMYVDWKAAGFGSSQVEGNTKWINVRIEHYFISQAIYAESEKVKYPNDEHLMQPSNPIYTYLNLIIDCAFTDPNTEKNSIAFGMAFILDPSKGIKLV